MLENNSQIFLGFRWRTLPHEQWSKNILSPYHNIPSHKCVSVCLQAWARGSGVCQRQVVCVWCVFCAWPSGKWLGSKNKKNTIWIDRQTDRQILYWSQTWKLLIIHPESFLSWLLPRLENGSHTHSCVQMSITRSNEVQRLFFTLKMGRQLTCHLKGSKAAPTTSKFLFCSPYVQLLGTSFYFLFYSMCPCITDFGWSCWKTVIKHWLHVFLHFFIKNTSIMKSVAFQYI